MTPSEWLFLMAAIGLLGVVYECTAPGWIFPGAAGGTLFAVGVYKLLTGGAPRPRPLTAISISVPVILIAAALLYLAIRGYNNKANLDPLRPDDSSIAR